MTLPLCPYHPLGIPSGVFLLHPQWRLNSSARSASLAMSRYLALCLGAVPPYWVCWAPCYSSTHVCCRPFALGVRSAWSIFLPDFLTTDSLIPLRSLWMCHPVRDEEQPHLTPMWSLALLRYSPRCCLMIPLLSICLSLLQSWLSCLLFTAISSVPRPVSVI